MEAGQLGNDVLAAKIANYCVRRLQVHGVKSAHIAV
jgi:hypothetical protein